jgi:hypothetical protein
MKLKFPLYHGTSTLFLDSIKKNGLGGRNIVEELGIINLLKELEDLCEKHLSNIEEWEFLYKYQISLITSQCILPGGNYQHGNLYLTPSLKKAAQYAENKFGSEILSEVYSLINLLRKYSIPFSDSILKKYKNIFDLEDKNKNPLIIEVNEIPIIYLSESEKGEPKEENIIKIEESIKKNGITKYQMYVSHLNFRSNKSIPWNLLTIRQL